MRSLILAAAASWALAGAAMAATPPPDLTAPIHTFIDAFNKGDAKTAKTANQAGALAIIDEVPPHIWVGASAFDDWAKALADNDKAKGISNETVTLGDVQRTEVTGRRAYVVIGAVYTFTQNGVAMREPARMTYALHKGEDGWKIAGWTWTGPKPSKAPPAKP